MLVLLASIYVIIASQCCSSLILEFDGSWRPSPRDPIPGFQTADSSFSSTTASASAALFRSHVDDDGNSADEERPFVIGAKSLSDTRTRTSADAEYEGLLMGLDQLATVLASCDDDVLGEHHELIIRGDCKAVIDQLNSRSNPRKTEIYYEQAIEKIQHIQEISSVTTFVFELVPRESNTLCDTLCKLVLNIEQKRVVTSVQGLVLSGEEEILSKEQSSVAAINNVHMRKRSVKKKSFRPKSNHYEVAMEEIRSNSRICQSSRLVLACLLSRSAIRTSDVAILLQLSDFFLQSSRKFTKIYWGDSPSIAVTKETLRAISILCELLTMLSIGAEEEALKLRTKHKIIIREDRDLAEKLNEEFDSLLEFCTNNEKKQDQALFPYSDIVTSEFLDKGSYREELLEWNCLATGLKTLKAGIWLSFNL